MNFYPHNHSDFKDGVRRSRLPVVYALSTPNFEYVKIGSTTSVKQRISNLQSGCPFALSLWLQIRTPKHREIESFIHSMMADCHLRGEWFKPGERELDVISDFFDKTNKNISEVIHALL